jgi:Fic family protein
MRSHSILVKSEVHPFLDGNGRIACVMMNVDLMDSN